MRILNYNKILYSIVLSVFLISFSFASETRVSTMGSNGIFLKDDSNVMLFPARIMQYSDLVISELRTKKDNSSYTIGLHMGYDNMASGLYINAPIGSGLLSVGLSSFGGLTSTLNNGYVFMFGMGMNDMDVGFGLVTAGSGFETGTGDTKTTESLYYIGVLGGVSNDVMDLGAMIELPSITQEIGSGKAEYSGFGLNAQGRYFLMKRRGMSIFPVGRVSFGSTSFEVKDGGTTDYSTFSAAVGVGVEKPINEDNTLVIGLEASMSSAGRDIKDGTESTTTVSTLPGIYVGVESRIASWLIGRVGAAQVNQQTVAETTPDGGDKAETTTNGSNVKVSLGLGMEFGNFLVDFAFNEGLLFDGPAVLSNTGELLASKISVTYNFGGDNE
ncbi:MAG: hypothetical protein D8M58_09230 [Calditrichaeota bacterium]|nr:MAG: hypothetical protein DWQ03_17260 [Calditrichota bacterium]MBL1205568.1 hypothetical protein [Calditrichota bacterium]NOG45397.1 hypothetical protein [Calditrichota bacterium]